MDGIHNQCNVFPYSIYCFAGSLSIETEIQKWVKTNTSEGRVVSISCQQSLQNKKDHKKFLKKTKFGITNTCRNEKIR